MKYRMNGIGRSPLLATSVLILGLLLAGCDDRVTVIRDSNIPIPKGSTWAWKPVAPPKDADRRPVVSRDVISRGEAVARNPWGWGPPEVSYENIRFREGTVVFDFVKQSTKRLAYRAIGQKPVHRDTFRQDEINEFVHHMLGKLKTNA
jgi:hypothetical protein